MATNPFDQFDSASTEPAFPGVIQGRPKQAPLPTPKNPYDIETDQRDFGTKRGDEAFDRASKLRDDFSKAPAVKEYQTVIRSYSGALQTHEDPTGDQALITAYAKMLDPGSVVREQEFSTVAAGDSAIGRTVARLSKELGVDDAGLLRPEVRSRVRNEMQNLVEGYNQSYNQWRTQYADIARRNGVNPDDVIGQHIGQPFYDQVYRARGGKYDDEGNRVPSPAASGGAPVTGGPGGVTDPEMRGGLPVGTEIEFSGDKPDGPFDRETYLKDHFGVTSDQEALITAFWNQNRGNASLTPDAVRQWYETKGLRAPEEGMIAKGIEGAKKGMAFSGFDTSAGEKAYRDRLQSNLDAKGFDPSAARAYGERVVNGLEAGLSDEIEGVGGAISNLFGNEGVKDGYIESRDTYRLAQEQMRDKQGWTGSALEFAGGLAIPVGRVRPGMSLGQVAGRTAQSGALAGFGYGEGAVGSVGGSALGALTGAALGAGTSRVGSMVGSALNRRAAARAPDLDLGVIAAGERQGIPIRQPDANAALRGRYGAAEATERGGPMIRQAIADDAAAVENRVAQVGGNGAERDPYALGSQVQAAGRRYIANTRQQANRLYDTAREAAGDTRVTPRNADAALDAHINELRQAGENSNGAAIRYLEGLRDDIDGGLSIQSMQNLRTNMRGQIGERGLTGTDMDRRVGEVLTAMNTDLAEQLPGEASQALRAADDFYRQKQEFITGTLQQFMGSRSQPLPAETAASRLLSITQGKGKFDTFSRMWEQLEPGEQADVAATVAAGLGRARNGDFSLARLVTSLDPRQGVNPRTAQLIFGDEGSRALSDLRAIAAAKGAAGSQRNYSASGKVLNQAAGGLRNVLLGGLGFSQGGAVGGIALPWIGGLIKNAGEQRAARMLLNPDFTRWLRQAPSTTNPAAIDRYFARLARVESIAANDNAAFTSAIREAVSGRASEAGRMSRPAAAQDEDDGRQ